jgi:isopentenyl-diphosphate Delta-isomerase
VRCPLQFLFKFRYQAQFDASGAEQELCSVYIGTCNQPLAVNHHEISDWRWIAPEALQDEMAGAGADRFTPWFRMEWAQIWRDHRELIPA